MIGMVAEWRKSLFWAVKVNLMVIVVDASLLLAWSALFSVDLLAAPGRDSFPLILLLESGIVFLIAGAIAMSQSIFPSKIREHVFHSEAKWSKEKLKKSEAKANSYIIAGIFLFFESVAVALLL